MATSPGLLLVHPHPVLKDRVWMKSLSQMTASSWSRLLSNLLEEVFWIFFVHIDLVVKKDNKRHMAHSSVTTLYCFHCNTRAMFGNTRSSSWKISSKNLPSEEGY